MVSGGFTAGSQLTWTACPLMSDPASCGWGWSLSSSTLLGSSILEPGGLGRPPFPIVTQVGPGPSQTSSGQSSCCSDTSCYVQVPDSLFRSTCSFNWVQTEVFQSRRGDSGGAVVIREREEVISPRPAGPAGPEPGPAGPPRCSPHFLKLNTQTSIKHLQDLRDERFHGDTDVSTVQTGSRTLTETQSGTPTGRTSPGAGPGPSSDHGGSSLVPADPS